MAFLRRHLLIIIVLAFIGGFVLLPLWEVVRMSFGGDRLLDHYRELLDPSGSGWEAVLNSLVVSLLSVALSGALGLAQAFVLTQFSFPFRKGLERLAVLPIALPPLVGVIAFLLAFGESGILPRLLGAATGLAPGSFSVDGFFAIVLIHVYSFSVYFMLLCSDGLRRMDGAALEAAMVLGSGPWRTFRDVMLPALRSSLLGGGVLTFMASMASFSAPFLFAGARRFLPLEIFSAKLNGDDGLAAASSVVLTFVSVGVFILLAVGSGKDLGPAAGKGSARRVPLPVPGWVRRGMIALAFAVQAIALLPLAVVVLVSLAQEGSWTWQILPAGYTWENYGILLRDPALLSPLLNSAFMALCAAGGALLIGLSGAVWLTRQNGGVIADALITLPHALPGTVVAFALILSFNAPSILAGGEVLVGSFWILPLAYVIRTYPVLHRSAVAALRQVEPSLVEAAGTLGAGPWRRWRTVVLPLILPGIVSGLLLVIIASLGEFVSSILLYTYASRPVSVEILAQLRNLQFGVAAALSTVLLALILLLVWLSGRGSAGAGLPLR